jgi:DNA-binding transcriptional LysR family regulator
MDQRDLRYFETIAELQHVGRAAQQLHRTQPALTSSIRRLEEACGAPLFERAGRGIRLTQAGRVLQKWARQVRFDLEDAQREVAAIGTGLAGQVRVGIVPTAAQFLLPSAARQLLQEAPGVTLRTVVALVDVLKHQLRQGELDLVVATEVQPEPDIVSQPLAEDAIVVAASAKHELVRARAPTMKDLARYRWALQPPGAPTRDWLDQAFDRKRLPRPQVQVESTMLLMLPTLIAETGLLSFISRHHLGAQGGAPLREIRLKETTMVRRLVVMQRNKGYLSAAALRLVELLAQGADPAPPPRTRSAGAPR